MTDDAEPTGPLAGLRVLELGTLIAAPFATRLLAEFGAEVIKVEAPGVGDPLRSWRKLYKGTSLWWYLQSRNKKSIAIDLKKPEGQEIVRRLVASCDVLVENFRPGTLERWGFGWEQLSAVNPRLIMVRISGFGQTGPGKHRPGFGAVGEALGGLRYTTGPADGPPVRVGISIADSLASLHAVIGALMALISVRAGGQGQVIDVSLVESVFNVMESLVPEYDMFGFVRERSGARLPGITPSNTYRSADAQWIVIAGNGDPIFRRLMAAIGRPDLADDPRLARNDGRVEHEAVVDGAIAAWVASNIAEEALTALEKAEVPASRIYSAADIVADPLFAEREMILPTRLPDGTEVKMPGVVPKLTATPGQARWVGPALGAHTEEVLQEIGVSAGEIDRLRGAGVIA